MNTPLAQAITSPDVPPLSAEILELLSYLMWGCAVLGVLGSMYGAAKMYVSRYPEDVGSARLMTVGGFVIALAAIVVRIAVLPPTSAEEATDPIPTAPPAAPDATATPAVDAAPDDPTDWTPLLWIGGAMLALALAAYLIVRTRSHIVDRRNAKKALDADYAAANAVYSEVADAYAAYLADPYAIFVRPLLDDLDEPQTAAFIDAFAEMNQIRPEQCPDNTERIQAFAVAAQKAHTAWRKADGYARAIGMGVTSTEGHRTVRRIRRALGLALDDSATGQERETALRTVQELAAGIVTIPARIYDSAKIAIETTTRKQLTS